MKSEKTFWAVFALNDPISNKLYQDLTNTFNQLVRWNEIKQSWGEPLKVYVPATLVNRFYNDSNFCRQLSEEFIQTKEMEYLFILVIKGVEENEQILVHSFEHRLEIFSDLISIQNQGRLNHRIGNMVKRVTSDLDDTKKKEYKLIKENAEKLVSSGIKTKVHSETCCDLIAAYFARVNELQPLFSYAALLLADYVNQSTGTSWEPQYWGYTPDYWNDISSNSSYLEMEYDAYKSYPINIFEKEQYQFSIPFYDQFTKRGHMIRFAISETGIKTNNTVCVTFIPTHRPTLGLNKNHIPKAVFNFTTKHISIEDNQYDYSMII